MTAMKSAIRDAMRIDWDVPITMDDGLVLRADVFRPIADGRYSAIVSYGPYGKGLAFQDGYKTAWQIMCRENPDAVSGTSNKYQNWEVVDPEKWVPDGYVIVGSNTYVGRNKIEGAGEFGISLGRKASGNEVDGNDFEQFKAVVADVMLNKGANDNVVTGTSGSVSDPGAGNQIRGLRQLAR